MSLQGLSFGQQSPMAAPVVASLCLWRQKLIGLRSHRCWPWKGPPTPTQPRPPGSQARLASWLEEKRTLITPLCARTLIRKDPEFRKSSYKRSHHPWNPESPRLKTPWRGGNTLQSPLVSLFANPTWKGRPTGGRNYVNIMFLLIVQTHHLFLLMTVPTRSPFRTHDHLVTPGPALVAPACVLSAPGRPRTGPAAHPVPRPLGSRRS